MAHPIVPSDMPSSTQPNFREGPGTPPSPSDPELPQEPNPAETPMPIDPDPYPKYEDQPPPRPVDRL